MSNLPQRLSASFLSALTASATAGADPATISATEVYTGRPIAGLPVATPEAVQDAFTRARVAQRAWATTLIAERKRILLRFHDLVLQRQDEALDLIQAENGKTRRDAFLEVADIAITARYYARRADRYLHPRRRRGAVPVLTHNTELRHPVGVVTVISPWNYPLSLAAGDTIPALLAGNAVVQKPDAHGALTALWARQLMREAGLPDAVWQLVIGRGNSLGGTLLGQADNVMFTGSTASGRQIAAEAGRRLIGASLELGGKNALIVLDDADVDKSVAGAVMGSFSSTGQLCLSIERIYVPDALFDTFATRFAEQTAHLKVGAAYDFSIDVGSLTSRSQLATVAGHVDDAVAKGARVLAGGRPRPDLGPFFYEPTILTGVTPEMTVHASETFGPVVSLYRYQDVEEAIALANDSPYGLNASVWGRDGARARAVAARVRAGTVNVNDAFGAAWGSLDAPMGGMGDSGVGRRHGADGILKYTESQTVAQQRLWGFSPPGTISPQAWARLLTRALRLLRVIGTP